MVYTNSVRGISAQQEDDYTDPHSNLPLQKLLMRHFWCIGKNSLYQCTFVEQSQDNALTGFYAENSLVFYQFCARHVCASESDAFLRSEQCLQHGYCY
jgi:hypothetical protein